MDDDQQMDLLKELADLKSMLRRCARAFAEMRYVDKYHALYGTGDSVEQLEKDLESYKEDNV